MDKERNEMNILVNEIQKNSYIKTYPNNAIIVKSKQIICPICDEDCRISIKDYKINLYDCKNNHRTENLPLDEFNNTQFINESKIICDICAKMNKNKSYNSEFYKCLECNKYLCPFCKASHDNTHSIINYDKKNFICNIHNFPYSLFCCDCNNNLCEKCENEHSNHKKTYFKDILENESEIKEEVKEFRKKIDDLNENINYLIKILESIKINIEIFYKINYDIINNYKKENINYQILKNIN